MKTPSRSRKSVSKSVKPLPGNLKLNPNNEVERYYEERKNPPSTPPNLAESISRALAALEMAADYADSMRPDKTLTWFLPGILKLRLSQLKAAWEAEGPAPSGKQPPIRNLGDWLEAIPSVTTVTTEGGFVTTTVTLELDEQTIGDSVKIALRSGKTPIEVLSFALNRGFDTFEDADEIVAGLTGGEAV